MRYGRIVSRVWSRCRPSSGRRGNHHHRDGWRSTDLASSSASVSDGYRFGKRTRSLLRHHRHDEMAVVRKGDLIAVDNLFNVNFVCSVCENSQPMVHGTRCSDTECDAPIPRVACDSPPIYECAPTGDRWREEGEAHRL